MPRRNRSEPVEKHAGRLTMVHTRALEQSHQGESETTAIRYLRILPLYIGGSPPRIAGFRREPRINRGRRGEPNNGLQKKCPVQFWKRMEEERQRF